ncbi:MAG: dihydroorotate dehydrogenase electron transfer subunit, partial [Oscillospiraceae bacterium]|nr:dihydroorotate dehydrogenase electron transfer subunit [Oscillospiraceae bacterium]
MAVIVEKRALTDGVFSLTFADGAIAENAAPGQFVHIRCGHSRILRRPFGVCDVNGERVTVVFAARGGGTDWLAGREPGQTLDVLGALGRGFTFAANSRVVLVGGGIGAAPLLYAAKAVRAAAVLGFKSERDMILRAEFE